jgi:type IV secretion system protein TrbG
MTILQTGTHALYVMGFHLISLLALAGCETRHAEKSAPVEHAVRAEPTPEPARPLEIVEIPQPLPLPGQLKPVPNSSEPANTELPATSAASPEKNVLDANAAARLEPLKSAYLNAIQVYPFSPGALYQVYTSPGRITDIALEPGEELRDVSSPDTVRWIIGDTESGEGSHRAVHIAIKPTKTGLKSNLAIYTSRRTYFLELTSTPETWMASVAWEYPQEHLQALKAANHDRELAQPLAESVPLEQLQFRYVISGDSPPWRPLRAFDDGTHVYIQFPETITQSDMPPLFILGAAGNGELVNYRARGPYYIVDRLFAAAELRLGEKKAQVVRIQRTDIPSGKRGRTR